MKFPTLLTAREAAPLLDVQPRTLARRAAAGKVPHYVIGEQRRYDEAEIRALAAGGAPAYPAPGSAIPGQPGYVVGTCGHRVAASEWRAGFRTCERCNFGGAK